MKILTTSRPRWNAIVAAHLRRRLLFSTQRRIIACWFPIIWHINAVLIVYWSNCIKSRRFQQISADWIAHPWLVTSEQWLASFSDYKMKSSISVESNGVHTSISHDFTRTDNFWILHDFLCTAITSCIGRLLHNTPFCLLHSFWRQLLNFQNALREIKQAVPGS